MKTEIAFWDTSALIPLCCFQKATSKAKTANRKFPTVVVWWGTPVEIYSSIDRLRRESLLTDRDSIIASQRWQRMYSRSRKIEPDGGLLKLAIEIPKTYNLRALDSFQLAAAFVWCGERPRNRHFITADRRLGVAASEAGFDVISL